MINVTPFRPVTVLFDDGEIATVTPLNSVLIGEYVTRFDKFGNPQGRLRRVVKQLEETE